MKAIFKRIDTETAAWDLDAGCRRFTPNTKARRKLRKKLRKIARKKINKFLLDKS